MILAPANESLGDEQEQPLDPALIGLSVYQTFNRLMNSLVGLRQKLIALDDRKGGTDTTSQSEEPFDPDVEDEDILSGRTRRDKGGKKKFKNYGDKKRPR